MAKKNIFAQALGMMARGKPKNYSKAEIKRRTDRLMQYNNRKIK